MVVLDEYPNLGWLGSKTYSTGWNDEKAWYQSGYAANAGGTQIPYAQGPFEVAAEIPEDNQSAILGKFGKAYSPPPFFAIARSSDEN